MFAGENFLQQAMDYQSRLTNVLGSSTNMNEVQVGTTPKDSIYEEGKLKLYRYRSSNGTRSGNAPILIVYALVNRPYIADLYDKRSLVKGFGSLFLKFVVHLPKRSSQLKQLQVRRRRARGLGHKGIVPLREHLEWIIEILHVPVIDHFLVRIQVNTSC